MYLDLLKSQWARRQVVLLFYCCLLASCGSDSNEDPAPSTPAPTITGFTPTSGPVGTSVTIAGTNFAAAASDNTVSFNGKTAAVTASSATSLTATVPTGATTGKISVTVSNQTATSSSDFTVTTTSPGTPTPTITGFSPTSGPVGTSVAISGTNFSATASQNTVTFNGRTASVTAASTTSLTAVVPAGATTGKISVTVNNRAATSANDFTVTSSAPTITAFSPTSGPVGTAVVIAGTNFSTTINQNTVRFNGTTATVTAATAVSLTATVPTGATTGKISVTVGGQTATSANDFTVTATPTPTVTVSTVAGSGSTGSANGTGTAASFRNPGGIVMDANGVIYVADTDNDAIRRITTSGAVSNFGSGFNMPTAAAVDASGNVYVADFGNYRIRRITSTGTTTTFAGSGTQGSADGTGTAASFKGPLGIAIDGSGNLYVLDTSNNIRKITPGAVVTTYYNGKGAIDVSAGGGIAVDASGNLYVADEGNHRIRKITPSGTVSTLAGSGTAGFRDGQGTAAQFNAPQAVSVDQAGNVYVADVSNQRIRKITPGGLVSTLAGGENEGAVDGSGSVARFKNPTGISSNAQGTNIVIADKRNHLIRRLTISN